MNVFELKSYDYLLPKELIANKLKEPRDASRFLVVDRGNKIFFEAGKFSNIEQYLDENSVLVMNETKVFPARLVVTKVGRGILSEMLFLRCIDDTNWEVLCKKAKKVRIGDVFCFYHGKDVFRIRVRDIGDDGMRVVDTGTPKEDFLKLLDAEGVMPLPPYIKYGQKIDYKKDYQTVFAKTVGSVAAPTAGFHFTKKLLKDLKKKGVIIEKIVLHIGLGTFLPVRSDDIRNHKMQRETLLTNKNVLARLNKYKKEGKKIVAIGTTSVRFLESLAMENGFLNEDVGGQLLTDLFIWPGYKFNFVDEMVTNFHLPKSTLLMLVAAFVGAGGNFDNPEEMIKFVKRVYRFAIGKKYRFFSFGDAMYIK